MKSGVYMNDDMIANVCKHHVTKIPYEIGRLAQDLAGGLVVTLPSQKELDHPEVGKIIRKYLKGRKEIATEDRMRILRLIENMTMGRNARRLPDRVIAWRGISSGTAGSDRAPDAAGVQEKTCPYAGRYCARFGRRGVCGIVRIHGPRIYYRRHGRYTLITALIFRE